MSTAGDSEPPPVAPARDDRAFPAGPVRQSHAPLRMLPAMSDPSGPSPAISVVVPVFNEAGNVRALHEALTHALADLGLTYEILIVDDGSTDGTRAILRELAAADLHLRPVLFRRNHGQTAAMAAGFERARGEYVISMDGDLQNDPADIPRLLERLQAGSDIVCGWRRHRKDRFATRLLPSRIANRLIQWVTKVPIHDTGCSLKAYRGWVVRSMHLYSDMHRFIAALAVGLGARVAELPVRHHARRFGQSKYGLSRIFRVLVDLIVIKMLTEFAAHPIRWFTMLSMPLALFGASVFVFGVAERVLGDLEQMSLLWLTAGTATLMVGLNVFLLGFLAELQLRASRFFERRVARTAREAVQ